MSRHILHMIIAGGCLLLCTLGPRAAGQAPPADGSVAWTPLFDGTTLNGWFNPYDWGQAEAKDGEIHLTTTKRKFFLVTEKPYADFVFEAEVKMPEGKSNSGFMFRCHVKKNRVWGYQAEVDPSGRKWSGGLYDEGRRKWFISPNRDKAASKEEGQKSIAEFRARAGECFKRDDWNTYRIECRGESIKISVNGTLCTDIQDPKDAQGFIAIQHHGEKGKLYRFRNVRIQDLVPAEPAKIPANEGPDAARKAAKPKAK
ncbi:MAG: DUF1080 domain-containing protein [Lentisphaerae bacterium]|jgi:hypothetical protein|nr:DUF1080 domain-containing protein [Lentisphaerota bacterium]MBT4822450.1 DUF1080 domain-containing protein [Lentisphaerota bacterium]MBT5607949.1 DUF1080 domain-containing protein [Lentisphaerota bacterium]MBT7056531.1 DUF1080 domain-containing protein [Lentisphaerota bacterium]MBT7846322.1 DUF1080 domain-containing protein [Lentisphaerota bacterium]